METRETRAPSEQESRRVAEQSRQEVWEGRGFLRELFLGRLALDLIHPFPHAGKERPEFTRFLDSLRTFLHKDVDPPATHPCPEGGKERAELPRLLDSLRTFLHEDVDPAAIDRTGEYPPSVLDGL